MDERLTAAQVRGARAMLDWSLVDLARAARVSVSSVKRIEDDEGSAGRAESPFIRDALETAGVVFLPDDGRGPGLRLRDPFSPASPRAQDT